MTQYVLATSDRAGVDGKTEVADACQMGHVVSRKSYEARKILTIEKNGGN